jgi:hypothetical protein
MTDEISNEQKNDIPEIQPELEPAIIKKSKRKTWKIIGIILGVIVACSVICVAIIGIGAYKVSVETPPVQAKILDFVKYMGDKDFNSAYALFSPQAQKVFQLSDLEKFTQGNYYILFDGIENLTLNDIRLNVNITNNPDLPSGLYAIVNSTITYKDGQKGNLYMVLGKENDVWMIYGFNITISPDKIDNK